MTNISEVQAFLFMEARCMDEGRYKDWLSLWTTDAVYWVPCNEDESDPKTHVSIIYDDRERLEQRVERLLSGSVLALDPKPKMRRVISNIEIIGENDDHITVESNFILGLARSSGQQLWIGRSCHELRHVGPAFGIVRKKVMLINNDQEIPLLQFLI